MNLDEFRRTLDDLAGPEPQLTDAARTRVGRGIRRTRQRRGIEAAAVVIVVAAVVISVLAFNKQPAHHIHVANNGGTNGAASGAGVFPDATGSVLILEDGAGGIVAVDLDHRVAVRRPTPGGLPEEQPTGIVGGDRAFFSGSNDVYAVPYDGTPAVSLGHATEFIPAAEPNAIWLLAWSGGREGAGVLTFREVDEHGNVLHQVNGPDPSIGFPEMGIPGGIAFETGTGVALWDAQTRTVTARLGSGATFIDAVHSNTLAWCEDLCATEHITQIGGRDLTVPAPSGAPNFSARSARFSPDGRYLAAVAGEGVLDESPLEIVLIDTQTGALRVITPRNLRPGVSLAWSPDSQRLFFSPSADADTNITLGEYDVATDQLHTGRVPFWGNLGIAVARSDVEPLLDAPDSTQAACPPPNQAGPTPTCSFHFDLATGSQPAPAPPHVKYPPCAAGQLTSLPPEWASPPEQQTDDLLRVTNEGATCQLSGDVSLVARGPGRPAVRATPPIPGSQPSNGGPIVLPKGSTAQLLVAANHACLGTQRYTTLTVAMPGGGSISVTLPQHNVSSDPDQNGRDLTLLLAPSCPPSVGNWTHA